MAQKRKDSGAPSRWTKRSQKHQSKKTDEDEEQFEIVKEEPDVSELPAGAMQPQPASESESESQSESEVESESELESETELKSELEDESEHETGDGDEENGRGYSGGEESEGSDEEEEEENEDEDDGEENRRSNPDENSTAFGRAFQKIMNKKIPNSAFAEALGPVLSAHKQLIARKLEEEINERKAKTETIKERHALREKGHTIPSSSIDAKEKYLIKLATKGVVKLFNAVSKAQVLEKTEKVTKTSDKKALLKQKKASFLAGLQGTDAATLGNQANQQRKINSTPSQAEEEKPHWAVLQDTFMLGKSKLKDWDKKQEAEDGNGADAGILSD